MPRGKIASRPRTARVWPAPAERTNSSRSQGSRSPGPPCAPGCPTGGEAQHGAGDELPAQRGNLSPASLALVIVHGLAHHFKWLVASLAHRSTQIGHRRRRDRLDGGALHGEVY